MQSDMWELLFHSNKHGQSFNTFMGKVGKIIRQAGQPLLLLACLVAAMGITARPLLLSSVTTPELLV